MSEEITRHYQASVYKISNDDDNDDKAFYAEVSVRNNDGTTVDNYKGSWFLEPNNIDKMYDDEDMPLVEQVRKIYKEGGDEAILNEFFNWHL